MSDLQTVTRDLVDEIETNLRWVPVASALNAKLAAVRAVLSRGDRLRAATLAFLSKYDTVEKDERYKAVWITAANCGRAYDGPTYELEMKELRAALGLGGHSANGADVLKASEQETKGNQ